MIEVLTSLDDFIVAKSLATLQTTVNDVDGGGKGSFHVVVKVDLVRFEEAGHDIVHTGLRILGSHVEPDSGRHSDFTILANSLGVHQELHLAVICAGAVDVRELAVVVVP